MDLTQIRYFLALARTLNFTRAAEACHVTQPALTKSIQRLESEFGGQLLLRERNNTQLTPLGMTMVPLLQQTFDAAETARLSALRFQQQGVARLRVGLGCRVEPAVVAPLIGQLTRRFPELEVTLLQSEPKTLNEWLLASEIDVTVTEHAEQLTDRANRWEVFADPIVVLFAASHALADGAAIGVESLRDQVLIGRVGPGQPEAPPRAELEDRYALLPPVRHRGASESHICTLVQSGIGVALSTARRLLPPGVVRRALEPPHTVAICVAALAGRPMSRAADAFLRLARARDWEMAS